jgi:hypothetical protein
MRPVTVGLVLTRFGYKVIVIMNRLVVAEVLLLSHQVSFEINGGVQQVIMGCNIALEISPSWLILDLDSKNAHISFAPRSSLRRNRN